MGQKNRLHEFALFCPTLETIAHHKSASSLVTIQDESLIHRIGVVLRMKPDDSCILFNTQYHATLHITSVSKKQVSGTLDKLVQNKLPQTHISYAVPLLKRDALDTALYALTELGINEIKLFYTAKTARSWSDREYERLQRVIHAAAEQAKQFTLPTLHTPIEFETLIAQLTQSKYFQAYCLFFDPEGQPLVTHLTSVTTQKPSRITLIAGPEGDLTEQEKNLLHATHIPFCALTPTILRAHQAIGLSAGVFRSILY